MDASTVNQFRAMTSLINEKTPAAICMSLNEHGQPMILIHGDSLGNVTFLAKILDHWILNAVANGGKPQT